MKRIFYNRRISGKINNELINSIYEELKEVQNKGKHNGVEISIGDINVADFKTLSYMVALLKSLSIRKKVTAVSDLAIPELALLSLAGTSGRKVFPYQTITFTVPEDANDLDDNVREKLVKQYSQLLMPLLSENLTQDKLESYIQQSDQIDIAKALALGIVAESKKRTDRKPKIGRLASTTPVIDATKTDNKEKEAAEPVS